MKKIKGPELKMPAVLTDLYWDLRDRRLLPLIGLVVLAIAAVPFLLGNSSKQGPPVALQTASGAAAGVAASEGHALTVVQAKPGLGDFHKRLAGRKPKDPFHQRFTAPVLKGAEFTPVPETEPSSGPGNVETAPSAPHEVPLNPGPGEPGGTAGGTPTESHHVTYYTFGIKARISRSGGKGNAAKVKQPPIVRDHILPQTALPGDKTPVVTFMGLSESAAKRKQAKPLFLVSADVKSVFGETTCVSGEEACQLIEVEPGFPVTFIYGPNEVHYTINVLKVELIVTGHSEHAPTQNFSK
jgi:hypothetical protein